MTDYDSWKLQSDPDPTPWHEDNEDQMRWEPDEDGGYELVVNEDLTLAIQPLPDGCSWHVNWSSCRESAFGTAQTVDLAKEQVVQAASCELNQIAMRVMCGGK